MISMTNDMRTPAGTTAGGEFAKHTRTDGGEVIENPELTEARERIGHAEAHIAAAQQELADATLDALRIIIPERFPGAKQATFFRSWSSNDDAFDLESVLDADGEPLWSGDPQEGNLFEIHDFICGMNSESISALDSFDHDDGELVGLRFE